MLRDRDAARGDDFVPRARWLGIRTLLSPVRAPRANAVAERVVRTLRNECLDRLVIRYERHFQAVLTEFVEHYSAERPHWSLVLDTLRPAVGRAAGPVRSTPILGGLHHVYERTG